MVKIIITQQGQPRTEVLVDPSKTVQQVVEENDIDLTSATLSIDGIPVTTSEFRNSLASMNITSGTTCRFTAVIKQDSGR